VKHLDCDTNTLIKAAGESKFRAVHHWFCGSVTASVPIFLAQVGISGGGASAARAPVTAPVTPVIASNSATQQRTEEGFFIVVFPY
jgi:hypothetical protein